MSTPRAVSALDSFFAPALLALFIVCIPSRARAQAASASADGGAVHATAEAPTACADGEHRSDGHCCPLEREWHSGHRRCTSMTPAQGCERGIPEACLAAGDAVLGTEGFDPERAFALYRRGCDGGSREACAHMGELAARLEEGRGVARDTTHALAMFQTACSAGAGAACAHLASMAESGRGLPRDFSHAASLYRQACAAGDRAGCTGLCAAAARYETGDTTVSQDYGQAAALYGPACDGGEARACAGMARMYQYGFGVQASGSRAAELYDRACDAGLNDACVTLGDLLRAGAPGLARDYVEASELYQSACDRNASVACFDLGMMYLDGHGVRANFDRANALFQRACRGGYARACTVTGH